MTGLYIIAECAQGFEGNLQLALLLLRGASAAKADAVKFQLVIADELAQPGYRNYDLFKKHEMTPEAWATLRGEARKLDIDFVTDVYGPRALSIARDIDVDGYKLHSTTFFDDTLTRAVLATAKPVYISVGGVTAPEIVAFVAHHDLKARDDVAILFGYQAEPTPIDRNSLARIAALRSLTGLAIGFQDHAAGDGPHSISLSALALGLGVRIFEKHVTLDRALGLIDNVSALPPAQFGSYVDQIRALHGALGDPSLELTAEEIDYRERVIKRVVARRDLAAGVVLSSDDLVLSRPVVQEGLFHLSDALGRRLLCNVPKGKAIAAGEIAT